MGSPGVGETQEGLNFWRGLLDWINHFGRWELGKWNQGG